MSLSDLVACSNAVTSVSSRNAKAGHLSDLLSRLSLEDEILVGVNFLIGKLRQGRIGLGPSAVRAALSAEVAEEPSLRLLEVDRIFATVAMVVGAGSSRDRVRILRELFVRATESERHFLSMLIYGELHQGALEGVMIEAIAMTATVAPKSVRRAVMATGDLAGVAVSAILRGPQELSSFAIELFRPVQPMLAQPAADVEEAFSTDRPLVAELKLDGARIQVHKSDDDVRVFSRRLRDVTHAVPEVVEMVRTLPAKSFVLDGEVIALRRDGRPLPFQTTMRRFGRKLDVGRLRTELPLTPFFFDILYHDGEPTVDQPLVERADLLNRQAGDWTVHRQLVNDTTAATQFLSEAMSAGHEGMMLKALDSTYEAGARGADWFKIKPTHTLDLVVLAAEWGHGRRTGWLSNLHLGARDPDTNGFVMLGKTFKGLTDQMLQWQTERLLSLEVGRDRHIVHVKPELLAEIAFNDVQESPRYPAGLALRFARVKRYREDKTASEADTIATVRSIHRKATQRDTRVQQTHREGKNRLEHIREYLPRYQNPNPSQRSLAPQEILIFWNHGFGQDQWQRRAAIERREGQHV